MKQAGFFFQARKVCFSDNYMDVTTINSFIFFSNQKDTHERITKGLPAVFRFHLLHLEKVYVVMEDSVFMHTVIDNLVLLCRLISVKVLKKACMIALKIALAAFMLVSATGQYLSC